MTKEIPFIKMADLQLLPSSMYDALCSELRKELPYSLKILSVLSRNQAAASIRCYVRMTSEGKPDPSVVVVRNFDERFLKYGISQDFFIFVHTQEQLQKVLDNHAIMDKTKVILFRDIQTDKLEWYQSLSSKYKSQLETSVKMRLYYLSDDAKLESRTPEDVEIANIVKSEHVHLMYVSWLHRELVTPEEFRRQMLTDHAIGIFLPIYRPTGSHHLRNCHRLVSWGVCNMEGSIGLVTTVSEHQNKGYARMVVSELCRALKEKGRIPVTDVDERSSNTVLLFTGLGFSIAYAYHWAFYIPPSSLEKERLNRLLYDLHTIDRRAFKTELKWADVSSGSYENHGSRRSLHPTSTEEDLNQSETSTGSSKRRGGFSGYK